MDAHLKHYEENKESIQVQRELEAKENPSCLSKWFPIVSKIPGVNTPKTYLIPIHFNDQLHALDSDFTEEFKKAIVEVKEKAKLLGYPVFIKNSLFSGKHNWEHTCFLKKEEDLVNHFLTITDFAYAVGVDDCLYWVVREYLNPTTTVYTDSKMPVTTERRYFIEDGKVVFHHPYWPEHTLENQNPTPSNWKELLVDINYESDEEIALLKELSEKVSQALPGAWSVDWLKVGDQWYLIDMGVAHRSFKWKEYALGTKGL